MRKRFSIRNALFVDKERSKRLISIRLGRDYVPKTLAVVRSSSELSRFSFDADFVVKANHLSGGQIIVSDSEIIGRHQPNPQESPLGRWHVPRSAFTWSDWMVYMDRWTAIDYSRWHGSPREMSYRWARKLILVEEFIPDLNSFDYKVFVVDGSAKVLEVSHGEGESRRSDLFMIPEMIRGSYANKKSGELSAESLAPTDEMINLAEKIAGNRGVLRVDFFVSNDRLLIGELTPFPQRSFLQFDKEFKAHLASN